MGSAGLRQRVGASLVLAKQRSKSAPSSLSGPSGVISDAPMPRVKTKMPSWRDFAAMASAKLREARCTLFHWSCDEDTDAVTGRGVLEQCAPRLAQLGRSHRSEV